MSELHWGYALFGMGSEPYIFGDWKHATKWMRQGFVGGAYKVHAVLYRRKKCCGKERLVRRGALMIDGAR